MHGVHVPAPSSLTPSHTPTALAAAKAASGQPDVRFVLGGTGCVGIEACLFESDSGAVLRSAQANRVVRAEIDTMSDEESQEAAELFQQAGVGALAKMVRVGASPSPSPSAKPNPNPNLNPNPNPNPGPCAGRGPPIAAVGPILPAVRRCEP